jgi:hypothetical protein
VNDPYDNHPTHPANQAEPNARWGYISPNQFADFEEAYLSDREDEIFDIDEPEKIAQGLLVRTSRCVQGFPRIAGRELIAMTKTVSIHAIIGQIAR